LTNCSQQLILNVDSLWNDLGTNIKLRVSIEIEVEGHLTTVPIKYKVYFIVIQCHTVKYYFVGNEKNIIKH